MRPMVYIDMDGVVADFEGWSKEVIGSDWKAQINLPSWGRFVEHPDLYLKLPVMEGAKVLYNACCEYIGDKNDVQFLTALPNRARDSFPDAPAHKIAWAKKHIDPHVRVAFGPFAQHKRYHIRFKEDVLIDDMILNIKQWRNDGGRGILHTSVNNTINELLGNKNAT
jgi:5'-nucleotidase